MVIEKSMFVKKVAVRCNFFRSPLVKRTKKPIKRIMMKKNLIVMTMLLTLGTVLPVAAQNKPKDPTELVDTTRQDGLEAYSDTTSADSAAIAAPPVVFNNAGTGSSFRIENILDSLDAGDLAGMAFVLCIITIVFVLSPLVVLGVLFYFIYKNRKQKIQLAQMAMQNGQPIPDQLLKESEPNADNTYNTGLRQLFLGIGLMVFLGYTAGKVGFGIGALVFFIGLGKVVIARTNKNSNNPSNL